MHIVLDGVQALSIHFWTFASIGLVLLSGQFLVVKLLRAILGESLTDADYLSISAAGWLLPVGGWAVLVSLGFVGAVAGKILTVLLCAAAGVALFSNRRSPSASFWMLLFCLSSLLVVCFAFLQEAIFPSYFDSAEHYRIIQSILDSATFPAGTYYHVGYHVLMAAMIRVFSLNLAEAMLVFGQIILAILPLPLFFIIRRETDSSLAAFFTVLLAGVGWHMPSHLLDWGKYPALTSLVGILFVIGLGYILYRSETIRNRRALSILIGVGVLISALLHSRSLVFLAGLFLASLAARWLRRQSHAKQWLGFAVIVCALVLQMIRAWQVSVFKPLFDGYLKTDAWMLILVVSLILFAIRFHTELTFLTLAALVFLFSGLFLPITISGYGVLTVFDRPYVQMMTYLPLSVLGGLGVSGLLQWIKRLSPNRKLPIPLTALLVFGLVVVNTGLRHEFYPSACCQLVSRDDLALLAWMEEELPSTAKVLIASANLYVTALESPEIRTGVDGGIWVTPLTARDVVPDWQGLRLDAPEGHSQVCSRSLDYVYVGGMPQSFDAAVLDGLPQWYRLVFSLPKAKLYRVVGCG